MPAVNFSPVFNGWQGFTPSGLPMSGGFLYTYQAGSSTPLATYTTNVGNVTNANPIILGTDGRPPQEIWLLTTNAYKFVLTDSLLNVIGTYDNISGIDNSVPAALSEWVVSGLTPSYVSATQFTLAGDKTALFEVGRRVRYTLGSGQSTGSISASVFGALTTVTVVTDSIPLDNTLSAVDYGFLDALKPSVPTAFKSAVTAPSVTTTTLSTTGNNTLGDALGDTLNVAAGAFQVFSDGRVSGSKLHNIGTVTGTTNQFIASGTYTPTLTNGANVTSSTSAKAQWIRVGNVVTVSGRISITTTATATQTAIGISLPIASNLAIGSDLGGTMEAVGSIAYVGGGIFADTANDRASVDFISGNVAGAFNYPYTFTYEVL